MAGEYLPPVVLKITADIDGLLEKMEAAQAKTDEFLADMQAKSEAIKAEQDSLAKGPTGSGGTPTEGLLLRPSIASQKEADNAAMGLHDLGSEAERTASNAGQMEKQLNAVRQTVSGTLPSGILNVANSLKSLGGAIQSVTSGLGGIISGFGSLGGIWTGPLSMLGSIANFGKTWAVMVPTLMAAPALLGAVGGALGGLAGSFTVASTAIGIFAAGAMQDLSYITSVSTMAQFDALSAPLQKLYYAYHNLSNAWTEMTQTMGGNTTIISVLTNMFTTLQEVLGKIAPVMGEIASAGQSAFNVLSGGLLGGKFTTFINWVGAEAKPVLTTFAQTFVNLAEGWTSLMEDLTPAITLFDNGMVHLTQTFANWAASPKGEAQVEGFINYIKNAWPDISKFWGGLGRIISAFFSSAAKGAPSMAADLGNFFDKIADAIPTLVKFADDVLPGIVKGFSAFTGGFFKGLSTGIDPLLKAFGAGGPNWEQIGDSMGKIAADLIELLPSLITVVEWMVNLGNSIAKIPDAIWAIVSAWAAFKSIIALGTIMRSFGTILGGLNTILTKIGIIKASGGVSGAAAGAEEGTAAAEGVGATEGVAALSLGDLVVPAAIVAVTGVIGEMVAKSVFKALQPQINQVNRSSSTPGPLKGFLENFELMIGGMLGIYKSAPHKKTSEAAKIFKEAVDKFSGDYRESNAAISGYLKGDAIGSKAWVQAIEAQTRALTSVGSVNATGLSTQRGGLGAGNSANPAAIKIETRNEINIQGHASKEDADELQKAIAKAIQQNNQQLVRQLVQTRQPG